MSGRGNSLGKEEHLLEAVVMDAVDMAARQNRPCFCGFFTIGEGTSVAEILRYVHCSYMLWGGFEDAERQMLGVFPDYLEPDGTLFPMRPVTAVYRKNDTLTHRDFLGALMALGIERSTIGDILVEPGRAVFFAKGELLRYIISQVSKVGSVGVKLSEGCTYPLPAAHNFKEKKLVVASVRLDCVAAACTGLSREAVKNKISSGMIFVDGRTALKQSDTVCEGARISVRGEGKFNIAHIGAKTKKGRIILTVEQYI